MQTIINKISMFFNGIHLNDEDHVYTLHGKNKLPSVSKKIESYYKEFDEENISRGVAKKRGVSQKQVLEEWATIRDEACNRGTRVHNFGEDYVYNRTLNPLCNQERAVVKFWNDLPEHIVPLIMELQMHHMLYMFAGTADIPLYNKKTDTVIIADYKTNKDLFKNFAGQKLLPPFENLLDNPFNKYQIQLSYYQLLFEQTGYRVSSRKIIWLKTDGNYEVFDTVDYTNELIIELEKNNVEW